MAEVVDPVSAGQHRDAFVNDLVRHGALTDDSWVRTFRSVPRHVFVPRYWRRNSSGERQLFDSSKTEQHAAWLAGAYSADSLVVQLSEDETAISSSTAPELMALMLDALQVREGDRVLEVGTGTGYNAALLCARLGSSHVTTIDIDADLVSAARDHLAKAGFTPTIAVANGLMGYPPDAPYDRIITTCAVASIPAHWIGQAAPGARIVTPLLSAVVILDVLAHGAASGRFLRNPAYFMPMRGDDCKELSVDELIRRASGSGTPHATVVPTEIEEHSFVFLMDLGLPGVELSGVGSRSQAPRLADPADGSWARVDPVPSGGHMVVQGGPRRLWDQLHTLHRLWLDVGRPDRDRFGLTVRPDGSQFVWLDSPDSEHRWEL